MDKKIELEKQFNFEYVLKVHFQIVTKGLSITVSSGWTEWREGEKGRSHYKNSCNQARTKAK